MGNSEDLPLDWGACQIESLGPKKKWVLLENPEVAEIIQKTRTESAFLTTFEPKLKKPKGIKF